MRTTKLLSSFLLILAACSADSTSSMYAGSQNAGNASAVPPSTGGAVYGDAGAPTTSGQPGDIVENDWVDTSKEATSTFGIDVDTGSYTLSRRQLNTNQLPNAVRTEEFVNYFHYDYAAPTDGKPFSVMFDGAPSKFGEGYHLVRIGLQGVPIDDAQRKQANLVFLVDVSGSMSETNKLPLVQETLRRLVNKLRPNDHLTIVTYAGHEEVLLAPTAVSDKTTIINAINSLKASGSTNGESAMRTAYQLAEQTKPVEGTGVNRVIMCTDGDFNVGLTGQALVDLVEKERDSGVTLTTLGFGDGGYNDGQLESLADHGNGNYAYIDSVEEIDRLVDKKFVSMLQVIAKDAKIQVEFKPDAVSKYRLLGYENRVMSNQDFADDKKDSGDLGAGHSVTAFYEVQLTDAGKEGAIDLAAVHFRYKAPDATESTLIDTTLAGSALAPTFEEASPSFRFAAATAEFAEILRKSKHSEGARFDDVASIANAAANGDADKAEMVQLVNKAKSLWH